MRGITHVPYSDLLRMNLLAIYGGIWIDSTFFCAGLCFEEYMQLPLWSIKRPDYLHKPIWEQSFPKKKNGKETFYAKLINGTLGEAYL